MLRILFDEWLCRAPARVQCVCLPLKDALTLTWIWVTTAARPFHECATLNVIPEAGPSTTLFPLKGINTFWADAGLRIWRVQLSHTF